MPRILQVIADGRPGGGATAVLTLSGLLRANGNEVVLATQAESYLLLEAQRLGFGVVGLDFSHRRRTPILAAQLGRLFRKQQPAVIHVHGARAGLPASMARRLRPSMLVYTIHGFHFLSKAPTLYWLAHQVEKFCISRADRTVFVSDADHRVAAEARLLPQSGAYRVIKNAVSVIPAERDVPKEYDLGFVGRLHPQKNPFALVNILRAMRPRRPSLCVVGGGDLELRLRERVAQEGFGAQVRFCGECGRDEALHFLSKCRVLVLPSLWEGHPITLIEAMLLGIPSVASDIPGNDEIVVNGRTGFLVPVHDVAAYAAHVLALLSDAELRTVMGMHARDLAMRDYSVEKMSAAYLDTYGEKAA